MPGRAQASRGKPGWHHTTNTMEIVHNLPAGLAGDYPPGTVTRPGMKERAPRGRERDRRDATAAAAFLVKTLLEGSWKTDTDDDL